MDKANRNANSNDGVSLSIPKQLNLPNFASVDRIDLSNSDLYELPEALHACSPTLTFLNLANNALSSLPSWLADFRRLRILFFLNNKFTNIPEVLGELPSLYMLSFKHNLISEVSAQSLAPSIGWLILTGNQISTLPSTIGRLQGLRKLMLSGNQLTDLPYELSYCRELELIRLASNQLTEIPLWLLKLPRLSWLAFAGNPCSYKHPPENIALVDWNELELINKVGSGASGEVHQALWSNYNKQQLQVAVKLFSAVSGTGSDGCPDDEIAAAAAIGSHPNILHTIGKLCNAPQKGLVFEFLSNNWRTLGFPPNFESVTRDTYPETALFIAISVAQMLRGISSALAFLHSKGIMHGDIYAHNIMVNDSGSKPLITDFGAATFYDKQADEARYFEAMEVRAFGCFMEELLDRVQDMRHGPYLSLRQLQRECMAVDVEQRPNFAQIAARVHALCGCGLSKGMYEFGEWLTIAVVVIPMMGIMLYLYAQEHQDVDAIV